MRTPASLWGKAVLQVRGEAQQGPACKLQRPKAHGTRSGRMGDPKVGLAGRPGLFPSCRD